MVTPVDRPPSDSARAFGGGSSPAAPGSSVGIKAAGSPDDRTSAVWQALRSVLDPEIPAVSVVDMGMIHQVTVDGTHARITFMPTFTGCPAVAIIEDDIQRGVMTVEGIDEVTVTATFDPPWTTGRITEEGRTKLREFGLAPPTGSGPVLISQIGLPQVAVCPFCGSKNTRNENAFGPTPCRALYYCDDCRNPFEQFKPV